jgi:hypothetical protein
LDAAHTSADDPGPLRPESRDALVNISAGATLFKFTGTGTISNDD